jgi:UDP-N-acetylmuramoyl-L-alanyl-D-glutamate--2,6-diaminopimelate ligase
VPERLALRAIGPEHLENALGALAGAILSGVAPALAAEAIERAAPRPGRFEVHGEGPRAIVDFAHSPDALSRTLSTARALCEGKLWLVFGAGGNRDRDKRKSMGEAARVADHVLLTTDNCRNEDPSAICAALRAGLTGHPSVAVELDRERAILSALAHAAREDVVLIAGRGPERELDLGDRRIPLVDAEVVEAALRARGATSPA